MRLQSENDLLKGKVRLLEDQVTDCYAQLVATRRERQRAEQLRRERDSQLLSEHAAANKADSGWRTRERKLLDEVGTARGQRGRKLTARDAVEDPGVLEDKAWLTQCAIGWCMGLQQAAGPRLC